MSWELVHTSVPQGLATGTSGFCTVARSRDLPPTFVRTLESLSGYRRLPLDSLGVSTANPVAFSSVVVEIGGSPRVVVSRVADAGLDHTGRANKIAHHFVLSSNDLATTSPTSLFASPRLFYDRWVGEARYFETPRLLPPATPTHCRCATWSQRFGDPGWAGYIASTVFGARSVVFLLQPSDDVLPLFLEATELLPAANRWDATFSTYFTKAVPGVRCQWKAVYAGTPEASSSRAQPNALVLDLTTGVFPNLDSLAQTPTEREFIAKARSAANPAAPSASRVSPLLSPAPNAPTDASDLYGLAELPTDPRFVPPVAQDSATSPIPRTYVESSPLNESATSPIPSVYAEPLAVAPPAPLASNRRNGKYDYQTELPRAPELMKQKKAAKQRELKLKIALAVVSFVAIFAVGAVAFLCLRSTQPVKKQDFASRLPKAQTTRTHVAAPTQPTSPSNDAAPQNDEKTQDAAASQNDEKTQDGAASQNDEKAQDGAASQNNEKAQDGAAPQNDEKTQDGAPSQNNEKTQDGAPSQNNEKTQDGAPSQNDEKTQDGAPSQNNEKAQDDVVSQNDEKTQDGAPSQNDEKAQDDVASPQSPEESAQPQNDAASPEGAKPTAEDVKQAFQEFKKLCADYKIAGAVAYAATIDGATEANTLPVFADPKLTEAFLKVFDAWVKNGRELDFGLRVELLPNGLIFEDSPGAFFAPRDFLFGDGATPNSISGELYVLAHLPNKNRKNRNFIKPDAYNLNYQFQLIVDPTAENPNLKVRFDFKELENTIETDNNDNASPNLPLLTSLGARVAFFCDGDYLEYSPLFKPNAGSIKNIEATSVEISRLYGNYELFSRGQGKSKTPFLQLETSCADLIARVDDAWNFGVWQEVDGAEAFEEKQVESLIFESEKSVIVATTKNHYKRFNNFKKGDDVNKYVLYRATDAFKKNENAIETKGKLYFPVFKSNSKSGFNLEVVKGDWTTQTCKQTLIQTLVGYHDYQELFATFQLPSLAPIDWKFYLVLPQADNVENDEAEAPRILLSFGKLQPLEREAPTSNDKKGQK